MATLQMVAAEQSRMREVEESFSHPLQLRSRDAAWFPAAFVFRLTPANPPFSRNFGFTLRVPHWFLILLLLGGSSVFWDLRRRRSKSSGFCAHCGYDLRAT